jgi:hypothetical protein
LWRIWRVDHAQTDSFLNLWQEEPNFRAEVLNIAQEELTADYDPSDFDVGEMVIAYARASQGRYRTLQDLVREDLDYWTHVDEAVVGETVRDALSDEGML